MSKFGQKIDLPYTGSLLPPTFFFIYLFFFFIFDTIEENKYADIETRLSMKERKSSRFWVQYYNKNPEFLFFLTKQNKKKKKKNTCRCY